MLIFVVGSAALVTAAGGNDQRLVLFYAVAVFLSFLAGMLAMTRLSYRARQPATLAVNAAGALVVGFTLAVNLTRGGAPPGVHGGHRAHRAHPAPAVGSDPAVPAAYSKPAVNAR